MAEREIDPIRLAKAAHYTAELDECGYLVTGGERPHSVNDDASSCDCPDFQMRGGRCKHILSVLLSKGDPETVAALRKLVPLPTRSSKTPAIDVGQSSRPAPIPEAGALRLWKLEVERGIRTMYFDDDLRTAAIFEANGRDEVRDGMIDAANESRRRAAEILVRRFAKAVA